MHAAKQTANTGPEGMNSRGMAHAESSNIHIFKADRHIPGTESIISDGSQPSHVKVASTKEVYIAFMESHQDIFTEYNSMKETAMCKDPKSEAMVNRKFLIAKIIVRAFAIGAEMSPISKTISAGTTAIYNIAETARQNERIVLAVVLEITDLLHDLFRMYEITVRDDDIRAFRVKELLQKISANITACQSDISKFLKRRSYLKIILVKEYENIFKGHASQFAQHRIEFRNAVGLYTADKVMSISKGVDELQQNFQFVLEKMDEIHQTLRGERQQNVIKYISHSGDIAEYLSCDKNVHILSQISGEKLDKESVCAMSQELQLIRNNFQTFAEIIGQVHNGVEDLNRRYTPLTSDTELNEIITQYFNQGGVGLRAKKFVDELALHWRRQYSKNHPDFWMLEFVDREYRDRIIDAIDGNASGRIDSRELVSFAEARPKGWSLLRWTVCWTAGWPISASMTRRNIHVLVEEISASADHCIHSEFSAFVDHLLQQSYSSKSLQTRPEVLQKLDSHALIPAEELKMKLNERGYQMESSEDVKKICNSRVEFWILLLIEKILHNHAQRLNEKSFNDVDKDIFYRTQNSIMEAFHDREEELSDYLKSERFPRDATSFAFGIFAPVAAEVSSSLFKKDQQTMNARVNDHAEFPGMNSAVSNSSRSESLIIRPLGKATLIEIFKRHKHSVLWDHKVLNKTIRSMMASEVVGSSTVLLKKPMFFDEKAPLKLPYLNSTEPKNLIRIGDLGVLGSNGDYRRLLNMFDPLCGHDGIVTTLETSSEATVRLDIDPEKIYRTANIDFHLTSHSDQFAVTYNFQLRSTSKRSGHIVVLPNGGFIMRIPCPEFLYDSVVQQYICQYAPTWYRIALKNMEPNESYNGALTLVRGVYVTSLCYQASFSSKKTPTTQTKATLRPFRPVPNSYLWQCDPEHPEIWQNSKSPLQSQLQEYNGSQLPEDKCFALLLSIIELDQETWKEYFAPGLPDSERLYNLANENQSVMSSISTKVAETARSARRFGDALSTVFTMK